MTIREVTDRTPDLIDRLLTVWESSVRATHHFLSESEIQSIRKAVPEALKGVETLIICEGDDGTPVAFMGVQDGSLEMLFIQAEERGKGLGRMLITKAVDEYSVTCLAVNEQNPQAKGFYEHMGFSVYRRSETDGQGNPYPLLYMKLN